ncbi:MAG: hypothetical protein M5U30_02265 [Burkholderiaceae bacterium]|nr:hypothetical protein [Burkholderiaceae bacterium]
MRKTAVESSPPLPKNASSVVKKTLDQASRRGAPAHRKAARKARRDRIAVLRFAQRADDEVRQTELPVRD